MGLNRDQYVAALKRLLPKGDAWSHQIGTALHKLCEAMAEEMVRYDQRVGTELMDEADPTTTTGLLTDWERICGLSSSGTLAIRRNAVLQKITSRGGQSIAFFIALADSLGFEVTITEFRPFLAGISESGDELTNGPWIFTWRVNAALNTVNYFRAGSGAAGEPLAEWSNDPLESAITNAKPAHTIVLFGYS